MLNTQEEQKRLLDILSTLSPDSDEYKKTVLNLAVLRKAEQEEELEKIKAKASTESATIKAAEIGFKFIGAIALMYINAKFGLIEPKALKFLL